MTETNEPSSQDDLDAVEQIAQAQSKILTEVRKAIYGQEEVIEHLLIALFARGHCLLMGVPGLAKTLLISTLAEILNLSFNRIQFTPDLMPSDITGTDILEEDHVTGKRFFKFIKGPVFANMLLADEINRTPPKTQAALLQSMQEYKVSAGGTTYPLELPFQVFATQNPIEQEGTYPLPEAQLDRFMFFVKVDYPNAEDEFAIVKNTTGSKKPNFEQVLSPEDIVRLQELTRPCRKRAEQILHVRSGCKHTGTPGSRSTRVCPHRRPVAHVSHPWPHARVRPWRGSVQCRHGSLCAPEGGSTNPAVWG